MNRPRPIIRQAGFAYIAAVVLLVVVAGVSVALLRMTGTQQSTVDQALLGARANQAARAGIEWMLYHIRYDGVTACPAGGTRDEFRSASGFRVTVTCNAREFNEGEAPAASPTSAPEPLKKIIYRIEATACNGTAAACPDKTSVGAADYVERKRVATICLTAASQDCY